ncbi:hypothetical protein [Jiella sonneratiae]|uniref:Uncharacterized protein n=1 Tax=Jiella sonneratiae TaxID=2816856 RepID=A0ABS3J9T9_9HYPH|nr:hypothetical protein [Jiella sonneratiae]MBO0905887.1 hypothetical protein [Jiella sonneratiae]
MPSFSRHAAPVMVRDGMGVVRLERVHLGGGDDGRRREAFVQELVHFNPDVIPMSDIEPAFTPLISICRELPTSAGYLDNLWMSPEGSIVLGECKLMRNPQARREVVAQALDYARAIHRWHYSQLEDAVRRATQLDTSLWDRVRDQSDLEEAQFIDAVERRLRFGRFMILIIGDGIQEGVEELTDFLQLHAGLHTSVALVDLSIWKDSNGRLLVVPRIPAKTAIIERGVVTVEDGAIVNVKPPASLSPASPAGPRQITASEPEFFDQIEQRVPGISGPLREFVTKVSKVGIEPEYRKSLVLRFHASPDIRSSAGYVDANGGLHLSDAWGAAEKLGRRQVIEDYLATTAALIGGRVQTYEKTWPRVVGPDGRTPQFTTVIGRLDEWVNAISNLVSGLRSDV